MSNTLVAILLLITFVLYIIYNIKGFNVVIGFFSMAIIWGILAGQNFNGLLSNVIQGGASGAASMLVTIIFGAVLGRVMMDTGIVSSIIKKVVELSGGKPIITAMLLSIVTTIIFSTSFGSGMVIAIGVIILPILSAIGFSKVTALAIYMMAIAGGSVMNPIIGGLCEEFVPAFDFSKLRTIGIPAAVLQQIAILVMLLFSKKEVKKSFAAEVTTEKQAPVYSFIVPLLPVLASIFLKWPIVPSYLLGVICAILLTGEIKHPKTAVSNLMKSIREGIADVAILLMLFCTLFMFTTAAGMNAAVLGDFFSGILPKNAIVLTAILLVLTPLALFRGPLNSSGAGAALFPILVAINVIPTNVMFSFVLAITALVAQGVCPTQGWVAWALGYTKVPSKDFLLKVMPYQWILVILVTVLSTVIL